MSSLRSINTTASFFRAMAFVSQRLQGWWEPILPKGSTVPTELPGGTQLCQETKPSGCCSVGTLGQSCAEGLLLLSYTAGKESMEKPTISIRGAEFSSAITKVLTESSDSMEINSLILQWMNWYL